MRLLFTLFLPITFALQELQGWSFPGKPACSMVNDVKKLDAIRMQYLTLNSNGKFDVMNSDDYCNGYSVENTRYLKQNTKKQYVTVAGGDVRFMRKIWLNQNTMRTSVNELTAFRKLTDFTGIEIDFEDLRSWSLMDNSNFMLWLKMLGDALHDDSAELIVTVGANLQGLLGWKFNYAAFRPLPIDYLTIMAYDAQYDYGVGTPRSPNAWIQKGIRQAKDVFEDMDRLIIGIATDCYYGPPGSYSDVKFANYLDTYKSNVRAKRDPKSYELTWTKAGVFYDCIDSKGIDQRIQLLEKAGITTVSLWYVGGNPLPSSRT